MMNPNFSEAVAGFGEPFPGQAGPFVTRPTAPYEHSTSSYLAANGVGSFGEEPSKSSAAYQIGAYVAMASGALSAYHGYKRNESIGWAIGWFFLGALVPPITLPIALAQGFGKSAKR